MIRKTFTEVSTEITAAFRRPCVAEHHAYRCDVVRFVPAALQDLLPAVGRTRVTSAAQTANQRDDLSS